MTTVQLTATDGHVLDAHRAEPEGPPRGGLVVVQEIFGVNRHVRDVADGFARDGYRVVAPALFDRVEKHVELDYDAAGFDRGRALVGALTEEGLLADLEAARAEAATAGRVGMVGYCFGGAVVWVAAARLPGVAAAVSYYGSRIQQHADLAPRAPVMMHVGSSDASFPLDAVEGIAARHASHVTMYAYDAGHGFNCDHRPDYDADAARLARERTLDFLGAHVG